MLEANGWSMWDSCEIYLEGYTISLRKKFPELENDNQRNSNLYFSWCWNNHGYNDFWTAKIFGSFRHFPNNSFMTPWSALEIRDITKIELPIINKLEKQMISALTSLSTLE